MTFSLKAALAKASEEVENSPQWLKVIYARNRALEARMAGIRRNLSTPENRAFWEGVEKSAAEVATWPAWKRAGINVAAVRSEPRELSPGGVPGAWVAFDSPLVIKPTVVDCSQFDRHGNGD